MKIGDLAQLMGSSTAPPPVGLVIDLDTRGGDLQSMLGSDSVTWWIVLLNGKYVGWPESLMVRVQAGPEPDELESTQ